MSDLARNIAVYLYERQGEIWSHIEDFGGISRPRNYQPAPKPSSLANPFLRKYRSAILTDEAARLYNSLAFAMDQYGIVMNGHMTVAWELFGVRDHIKAASVLTEFNARTRKWLEVDGSGRRRKGTRSTVWGPGEPFYYAYVHEHASTYGFHTHELFHVSDGKARAFAERAVTCLAQLTGVTKPPAEAVVITPSTKRDGFAPYLPRFKRNEEERCWVWFRYLAKNLSPHEFKQVGNQCGLQRDIFRIRPVFIAPAPVACTNLFGCSENIAVGAQTKAGFASKFDRGDWKNLYSSSELDQYRQRQREWERQQELASTLGNVTI